MRKLFGRKLITMILATAVLTAAVLTGCGSPAEPGLPEETKEKWRLFSEAQWRVVAGEGDTYILESVPQEIDYEAIREILVDPNAEPDLALVEAVKNDPNAMLPDNYLPDGRVLVEDWIEQEQKIVEQLSQKSRRILAAGEDTGGFEERSYTKKFGDQELEVRVVSAGDEEYAFLVPYEYQMMQKLPGKEQWICSFDERNLWLVDLNQEEARPLLSGMWSGLTFEELMERRMETQGWGSVTMCGSPSINPSGTKLIYVAEKEELCNWNYSIFMYDVNGKTETLHAGSPDHYYGVVGWINDDEFLAIKARNGALGTDFVVINTRGEERLVNMETDQPHIMELRGDKLTYMEGESQNIWITEYQGDGVFETLAQISLGEGRIIMRAGDGGLNPSGDLFAFLYAPDDETWDRYLQVYDLKEQKMIAELEAPAETENSAGVQDIWWISDEELLVNGHRGEETVSELLEDWPYDKEEMVSTWIYNVNGTEPQGE